MTPNTAAPKLRAAHRVRLALAAIVAITLIATACSDDDTINADPAPVPLPPLPIRRKEGEEVNLPRKKRFSLPYHHGSSLIDARRPFQVGPLGLEQ